MNDKIERLHLNIVYEEKQKLFQSLAEHLLISAIFFILYRDVELEFPPTQESHLGLIEELREIAKNENSEHEIKLVGNDNYEDLIKEFRENKIDSLKNLDVKNFESFTQLNKRCLFMRDICSAILKLNVLEQNNKIIKKLEQFGNCTISKAHELMGYQTAKMEEKRKNLKGAEAYKAKKLSKKEIVKKLYNNSEYKDEKRLITEAMNKIDRGERTVKNFLKEIKEEST